MRMSKCRICRQPFRKISITHKDCSPECAIEGLKLDKAKNARKAYKAEKNRLKSRREWIKDAQKAFNAYIRKRDMLNTCICCNMPLVSNAIGGGFDCGHYRSIGSAPHLRFDERNAHGQRKQCNRWGSGRAVDYRLGLIKRIGLEQVIALESDQNPRKYTIDDLKNIIATYKAKIKLLEV